MNLGLWGMTGNGLRGLKVVNSSAEREGGRLFDSRTTTALDLAEAQLREFARSAAVVKWPAVSSCLEASAIPRRQRVLRQLRDVIGILTGTREELQKDLSQAEVGTDLGSFARCVHIQEEIQVVDIHIRLFSSTLNYLDE